MPRYVPMKKFSIFVNKEIWVVKPPIKYCPRYTLIPHVVWVIAPIVFYVIF